MRRPLRLLVVSAAAVAAAGCGQAHDALSGLSPAQAVSRAAARAGQGGFRVDTTQAITLDASQLPAAAQQGFGGRTRTQHQTVTEDVESPRRLAGVLSTDSRSGIHMVVYDGTVYLSADGTRYEQAPTALQTLTDTLSTRQIQDYASHLGQVRDRGRAVEDGVETERYDGTLDAGYLTTLSDRLLGSLVPAGLASSLGQALHYDRADVTLYVVRASGALEREVSTADVSVDLGRLTAQAGGGASSLQGTLRVDTNASSHLHDYGARISVSRPASSGTMSLQELASLFGTAPTG
jgi:hypothetical protein